MKKNTWGGMVVTGIIGIALGWLIWGMNMPATDMHRMSDGSMMRNDSMSPMEGMMHDMNASLEGKTGDAFDREFLDQMIVHHEGAVAMARKVQAVSKRPELLKLADDIIKAQTGEIEMMQGWREAWFK